MYIALFVLILSISGNINAQYARTSLDNLRPQYAMFSRMLHNILGANNDANLVKTNRKQRKNPIQDPIPISFPFPCDVTNFRSVTPPTSVHELMPGDIDVIGAIGDSLTVGNGLLGTNVVQTFFMENRGVSWSIGGEYTWRQFLTIPNILKVFNPNLIGYSLGTSLSTDRKSQFNPAERGAISSEMPYMVEVLIKRMKSDPRVDFEKHWKLVTILFGSNDFCNNICLVEDSDSLLIPHKNDLLKVLRTLRDKVPRLLVNLVAPPNAAHVKVNRKHPECDLVNWAECYCFVSMQHMPKQQKLMQTIKKWQDLDITIANMEEFQRDDFTVVLQPFFKNLEIPVDSNNKTDLSFLSNDCFHFSQKTMAKVANSYWNNLLQRVGQKTAKIVDKLLDPFLCPTKENPYIFTRRNS